MIYFFILFYLIISSIIFVPLLFISLKPDLSLVLGIIFGIILPFIFLNLYLQFVNSNNLQGLVGFIIHGVSIFIMTIIAGVFKRPRFIFKIYTDYFNKK